MNYIKSLGVRALLLFALFSRSSFASEDDLFYCREVISLLRQSALVLKLELPQVEIVRGEILEPVLKMTNSGPAVISIPELDPWTIGVQPMSRMYIGQQRQLHFEPLGRRFKTSHDLTYSGCAFRTKQLFHGETIELILPAYESSPWLTDKSNVGVRNATQLLGPGRLLAELGPVQLTADYYVLESETIQALIAPKSDAELLDLDPKASTIFVVRFGKKYLIMIEVASWPLSTLERRARRLKGASPAELDSGLGNTARLRLAEYSEAPILEFQASRGRNSIENIAVTVGGRSEQLLSIANKAMSNRKLQPRPLK